MTWVVKLVCISYGRAIHVRSLVCLLFTAIFLPEMNEQEHCQTYAKCASDSHHYGK